MSTHKTIVLNEFNWLNRKAQEFIKRNRKIGRNLIVKQIKKESFFTEASSKTIIATALSNIIVSLRTLACHD